MSNALYDLVRVATATVGTGAVIALGAAVTGFLTPAQGGVPDGAVVTYGILDPVAGREIGKGTYSSSGNTITRNTIYRSSASGNVSAISLSGSAQIFITVAAEDLTGYTANKLFLGGANGGLSQSSLLHWDGTNSFLGIGNAAPKARLSLGSLIETIKLAVYDDSSGGALYGIGVAAGQLTFGANLARTGTPQMVLDGINNHLGIGITSFPTLGTNGSLIAAGELISTVGSGNYGGVRLIGGNYGFFLRNDGTNSYFLLTASGSQYGTWSSLRPITIANATGAVSIGVSIDSLAYYAAGQLALNNQGTYIAAYAPGDGVNGRMFLGNPSIDPTNYYRATNHAIQDTAGATTFLGLSSSAITVGAPIHPTTSIAASPDIICDGVLSIATGSNAILKGMDINSYWFILVCEIAVVASYAMYMFVGGIGTLVNVTNGTPWVAPTTTPASTKISVAGDGTNLRIYNNMGSTGRFQAFAIRVGRAGS